MMLFGEINANWYLPPLVIVVSLVYGATRYETWPFILRHALLWSFYILSFLAGTYFILYLVAIEVHPYWYAPILAVLGYFFFVGGQRRPRTNEPPTSGSSGTNADRPS